MRHLANWLNLSTPLGLALARVGGAHVRCGPMRLYLADRYRWPFPTGPAFTIGDVVLSRHDLDVLLLQRPYLLRHEERHARQWMACGGMPFLPLYLGSLAWSWVRTGDRAAGSVFERRAGLADGGYVGVPVRPLGPVLRGAADRLRTAVLRRRSADVGVEVGAGGIPSRP